MLMTGDVVEVLAPKYGTKKPRSSSHAKVERKDGGDYRGSNEIGLASAQKFVEEGTRSSWAGRQGEMDKAKALDWP